jgi:hypothetical protein
VTLPNVRWGLLYGVLLCNARAMGEFGAVSVVSGHIRGLTNTMPLHVEILYNEYDFVGGVRGRLAAGAAGARHARAEGLDRAPESRPRDRQGRGRPGRTNFVPRARGKTFERLRRASYAALDNVRVRHR